MQHVIPFKFATAAAPAGNDGIVRISAGTIPWEGRTRVKVMTASGSPCFGYWGAPDMTKAQLIADVARFGASGDGANNSPPTFDFLASGGLNTGIVPTWYECPSGGSGNLMLFGTADGVGVLIFEPVPHVCCPACGHRIS